MTGALCAIAGSTSATYTGSATVTVGLYDDGTDLNWGFINVLGGSISPANWANSGLPFYFLYWSTANFISFQVTGFAPNVGWNIMNINGTNYNRVDASYGTSGGNTYWLWSSVPTNPFGTSVGATKVASWF